MKRLLLALAALTLSTPALADTNPPPLDPTQSVVDSAHILNDQQVDAINAQARTIYDQTHHHIVVLTMPSLDGADPAEYANNAFRFYAIGNKTRNDGVLLLISMSNPRRLQIAVGYGLEGVLTDLKSTAITDSMKPVMKSGDYAGAIEQGVQDIGDTIKDEVVTPQALASSTGPSAVEKAQDSDIGLTIMVICIVLLLGAGATYLFIVLPRRRREREYEAIERARIAAEESERLDRERAAARLREREALNPKPTPVHEAPAPSFSHHRPTARIPTTRIPASTYSPPVGRSAVRPAPTPVRDNSAEIAAAAALAAEQARADQRRRDEAAEQARADQRRRDDEAEAQRQRDSWNTSSSWSTPDTSSSWSTPDTSSSFDSGGSSGGGGGGSDW